MHTLFFDITCLADDKLIDDRRVFGAIDLQSWCIV